MRFVDNMACKVAGICRLKIMRWAIAFPIAAIMAGTYILAIKATRGPDFSIAVDAGVNRGTVSQLISGSNLVWHHAAYLLKDKTNPQLGMRDDLKSLASAMGASIMLFPGGSTAERYHWRLAVGPLAQRQPMYTSSTLMFTPYFGTDEFMDFCTQVGCQEKVLIANFCTGTAQEAANWVEYCNSPSPTSPDPLWKENSYKGDEQAPEGYFAWLRAKYGHTEPYHVRYWIIGNECYAMTDLRPDMSAQVYANGVTEYAAAMKNVDPTIKIGAVATNWPEFPDWNSDVIRIAATSIDFVAPHFGNRVDRLSYENFYYNSTSARSVYFATAGTYTFCVRAWGRIWAVGEPLDQPGQAPEMEFRIDGQSVYTWDVRNLQKYECTAAVPAGYHKLSLSFINDYDSPDGNGRDLFVYGVTRRLAGSAEENIWYPDDAEQQLLFNDSAVSDAGVRDVKALIAQYSPSRSIDILVTESSMGYPLEGNPYYTKYPVQEVRHSLRHKAALWEAGFLNMVIREQLQGNLRWVLLDDGNWGDIREPQMTANGTPLVTPMYHTMKLYSRLRGTRLIDTAVTCPTYYWPDGVPTPLVENGTMTILSAPKPVNVPYMDVVSTRSADGLYLYITVLNRSRVQAATQITIASFRPSAVADVQTLGVWNLVPRPDAIIANRDPEMEARNDTKTFDGSIVQPDNVSTVASQIRNASAKFTYTFKPYSVTMITLKKR